MHRKRPDPMLPQHPLLFWIDIPQANVHQLRRADPMLLPQPPKHVFFILHRQPRQETQRHPVHVSARRPFRRVDIRVRIHPDNCHLAPAAEALPDRFRGAGDGADSNGVVAAEGQNQSALTGVVVDLRAQGAVDGADGPGPFHIAVVGVVGVEVVVVRMDLAVVCDVVV